MVCVIVSANNSNQEMIFGIMAHNTNNMRRTETRPAEAVGGGVDRWMAGWCRAEQLEPMRLLAELFHCKLVSYS